jgi:hypothetical protein
LPVPRLDGRDGQPVALAQHQQVLQVGVAAELAQWSRSSSDVTYATSMLLSMTSTRDRPFIGCIHRNLAMSALMSEPQLGTRGDRTLWSMQDNRVWYCL